MYKQTITIAHSCVKILTCLSIILAHTPVSCKRKHSTDLCIFTVKSDKYYTQENNYSTYTCVDKYITTDYNYSTFWYKTNCELHLVQTDYLNYSSTYDDPDYLVKSHKQTVNYSTYTCVLLINSMLYTIAHTPAALQKLINICYDKQTITIAWYLNLHLCLVQTDYNYSTYIQF